MSRHPELPERDRRILAVLVHAYIDQGEPVSSLWLANRGFGVSSATLRNIMARLEDLGYVRQPHTSAGRVPTDLGYRLYVDQLLVDRKSSRPAPQVEARLRLGQDEGGRVAPPIELREELQDAGERSAHDTSGGRFDEEHPTR